MSDDLLGTMAKKMLELEEEIKSLRERVGLLENGNKSISSESNVEKYKKSVYDFFMSLTGDQHKIILLITISKNLDDIGKIIGSTGNSVKNSLHVIFRSYEKHVGDFVTDRGKRAEVSTAYKSASSELSEDEFLEFAGVSKEWNEEFEVESK